MLLAQTLALTVDLGDIIVAGSVAISVVVAYYALKARIDLQGNLTTTVIGAFGGRMDAHARRLKKHTRTLHIHGRKIAGLEGRVFNRRVEDVDPADETEAQSEDL